MLLVLTLCVVLSQVFVELPLTAEPQSPGAPASASIPLTLRFDAELDEAIEIVRLARSPSRHGWQVANVVRGVVRNGTAVVEGPVGAEALLLIRAPGRNGYLLEGPLRWPVAPTTRVVQARWRRTVRGRWPADATGLPTWVAGVDEPRNEAWPECRTLGDTRWECAGVPLETPGAIVAHGPGGLFYALATASLSAPGVEVVDAAVASWGRLIVVGRADRVAISRDDAITIAARQATVPRMRPRSVRLDLTPDERVTSRSLGAGVFWVSGSDAPERTWIEIAGRGRAPARIPVLDVAAGPLDIPHRVELDAARSVAGRVVTDDGRQAGGAIVLLSRLLPELPGARDPDAPARRVLVAETTSDSEGNFTFVEVGREPYEVVAVHSTAGRGERLVSPDEGEFDVRLKRPSIVTGLVMRDGTPASGIDIAVVPDLAEVAASGDLTELLGAQAKTGEDGRFEVAVPPRGSSQVRVGSAGGSIRRLSLAPAETLAPRVDLGVIQLDPALVARLVLEAADGCELMVSGPVGKSGLTVVKAERIGPSMFEARVPEDGRWLISARCGSRDRRVTPSLFEASGSSPLTVPLVWRP